MKIRNNDRVQLIADWKPGALTDRRYKVLDNPLPYSYHSHYDVNCLQRGVVPDDAFDRELLPGFLACTNCNLWTDHVFCGTFGPNTKTGVLDGFSIRKAHPSLARWVLGGLILVCMECGADLT